MINKNKRILSLFLSILMILSIVPTSILADSWINGSGYDVVGSSGGGGGRIIREFENKLNSMNGYKVSMYYCPATYPNGPNEPYFDWSADNKDVQKVGRTIYFRRDLLKYKNTGELVLPAVYNNGSIYAQTTLGHDWREDRIYTEKEIKEGRTGFDYHATQAVRDYQTDEKVKSNFFRMNNDILDMAWEYIPKGPESEWNPAEKGLVDWIQRLFDMENPDSIDITKIQRFESNNTLSGFEYRYPGKEHFGVWDTESYQIKYPPAMAKGSDAQYEASIDYLKSYFLSPAFLNEFFYLQGSNTNIEQGEVLLRNFLMGNFSSNSGDYEKGQFKLYIEPVLFRAYNSTDGLMCMSWRDVMLEHQSKQPKNNGFCQLNTLLPQLSNSFTLAEKDYSLKYGDTYLGESSGTFKPTKALSSGEILTYAKDNLNTLGVMVITSPSLNAYIESNTPEVIKTYSVLTGINEDGTFKYEKFAESTKEKLEFYMDEQGNDTLYPVVAMSEQISGGHAVLNDIVTTDKDINISSSTEWTNSALITGVTGGSKQNGELESTAQDIVGSKTGIITGSPLYFSAYTENAIDWLSSLENYMGDRKNLYSGYLNSITKAQEEIIENSTISTGYGYGTSFALISGVDFINTAELNNFLSVATKAGLAKSIVSNLDKYFTNVTQGLLGGYDNVSYGDIKIVNKETNEIINSEQELVDYLDSNGTKLSETKTAIGRNIVSVINNTINYTFLVVSNDEGISENDGEQKGKVLKNGGQPFVISEDSRQQIKDFYGEYIEYRELPLEMGYLLPNEQNVLKASKLNETVKARLAAQSVGQDLSTMDRNVYNALNTHLKTPNTLILRYLIVPTGQQIDVVELYRDGVKIGTINGGKQSLNVVGDTVTIQKPKIELEGTPVLSEYVTNSEFPIKDISNGVLPTVSPNGLSGDVEGTIANYPIDPYPQNLYVKWRVEIKTSPTPGTSGGGTSIGVPEWRLSKYISADKVNGGFTYMSLPISLGCCGVGKLNGTTSNVSRPYLVVNPNGKVNDGSYTPTNMKYNSWMHAATEHLGTIGSVSIYSPTSVVAVDGVLNAVKSTDTSGLKSVNWLQSMQSSNTYLKDGYDVSNASKGTQFNSVEHQKYVLNDTLRLNTLNVNSYNNTWPNRHSHKKGGHCHRWVNSKTISTLSPTYIPYYLDIGVTFDRYNQINTDSRLLTVQQEIKSSNGLTTLKYQDSETLNVYPEYGMLFDNDNGDSSIKWMVGDQARKIQPVVYQTMEHKVYVKPTSTGNMATDNRARTSLNKVVQGDNTANGKQVLYKGGPVNTAFQMYRDSGADKKGILTVKTFALDIKTNSNGVNVKNEWGNSTYDSKQSHTSLLKSIDENSLGGKANVSEKLLVDSPVGNVYDRVVDYTGALKSLVSDKYTKVKYGSGTKGTVLDNGTTVMFEHELVVRGGQVIGVYLMNRGSGNKTLTSIDSLANKDVALYNALINMNLYDVNNNKANTVLSTFEHKTGDTLTEGNYATMLQSARQSVDSNLVTPDHAKVFENEGWYSEDTTVLVVKEYVTNYEVPSISLSDKLSMSVKGLDTPIDKNQFFSVLGKGYTYLKYDLPLTIPNPKGGNFTANSYFETTSLPNDGLDSFGYQGVDYLVPNVSISDTTRMN